MHEHHTCIRPATLTRRHGDNTARTTSESLGQSYRMTVTYQAETQTFCRRAKLFSELLRDLGELIISAGAEDAGAPTVAGHRSLQVGRS
jgi:hypothetical protein